MAEFDDGDYFKDDLSKIKGEDRYNSLDDYWNSEVDLEEQRDREEDNLENWRRSLKGRKKEENKAGDRKEIQNVQGRISLFKTFANNRETWKPSEKIKSSVKYQREILTKEIEDLKVKLKNARKKEIIEGYAREIKYKQDSLKHLENVLIPASLPPPEKPASLPPPEKPAPRPENPAPRPEKLEPPQGGSAPGFFEKFLMPLYTTKKSEEKIDVKSFENLNKIINDFNNRIIKVENEVGDNNELRVELENFKRIQTDFFNRSVEIANEEEKEEERRKEEDVKRDIEIARRISEEVKRSQEEIKREREERKRQKAEGKEDAAEKARQADEDLRQRKEDVRQKAEDVRQQIEDSRQIEEDTRQKKFNEMIIFFQIAKRNVYNNSELIGEKLEELDSFRTEIDDWLKKILGNFTKKTQELQARHEERLAKTVSLEERELDIKNAEEKRMDAEKKRVTAESRRVAAEAKRVGAEVKRTESEVGRIEEEERRFVQEKKRYSHEILRSRNNRIIIENEKERIQNEKNRIHFEKLRVEAEEERQRLFDEGIKSLNEKINLSKQKINERDASLDELHGKMEKLEGDLEKVKKEIKKNPAPQLIEKRSQLEEELKTAADTYFEVLNERIIIEERKSKERDFAFQENLKLLEEQKSEWFNLRTFKEPLRDFIQEPIKFFESYFTSEENTLDWIENKELKEKTKENLDNIEEKSPEVYRNALLDGISLMETKMLSENWENLIFEEKNERKDWEYKFEKLKPFLDENRIYFSVADKNLYDFFKENVTDNFTPATNELNGFTFRDRQIFKRKRDHTFYSIDSPELREFLDELKSLSKSANSIISENLEIFADTETNKEFARDYIENLREEQRELIQNTSDEGEYFQMEEFNTIEKEIAQIRNNKTFKIRPKVWAKSFGGRFLRILNWVKRTFWRHKIKVIGVIVGMITSTISAVVFTKQIDRASNYVKNLGHDIMNESKNILQKLNQYSPLALISSLTGFILYYFGDGVYIFSKVIFTPIVWGFSLLTPLLVGIILGGAYKLTNFGKYQGINLSAFSYFLANEYPPDDLLKYLAEENEMTLEEYKEKYVTEDKLYDNFFAKLSSYIIYPLGKGLEITSEAGEGILNWASYFSKIIIGALILFVILFLLNKWRS